MTKNMDDIPRMIVYSGAYADAKAAVRRTVRLLRNLIVIALVLLLVAVVAIVSVMVHVLTAVETFVVATAAFIGAIVGPTFGAFTSALTILTVVILGGIAPAWIVYLFISDWFGVKGRRGVVVAVSIWLLIAVDLIVVQNSEFGARMEETRKVQNKVQNEELERRLRPLFSKIDDATVEYGPLVLIVGGAVVIGSLIIGMARGRLLDLRPPDHRSRR